MTSNRAIAISIPAVTLAALLALAPAIAQTPEPAPVADPGGIAGDDARAQNMGRARDSYRKFLDLAEVDDPRRARALRRLADLELERAEEALASGVDASRTDAGYAAAIDLYNEYRALYPDDANNDVVLYQLARAYGQRGETERALAAMAQLTQRFADSPYVDESHFRRGESLFSQGSFSAAGDAYAAVLARGDSSAFYDQALYKHGWSMFRLSNYEAGVESFYVLARRVLAPDGGYSESSFDQLTRAESELLEDALRATSISFSYLEGVETLSEFLAARKPLGFEHLFYQRLGDLYLAQERYNDAAQTYAAFPRTYPGRDRAPTLQLAVIETYRNAGFAEKVLAAKEEFSERYALTGPFWERRERSALPEVVEAIRTHLGDLTRHHHALAQSSESVQDYANATRWYRLWLDSFPQDPEAPATRFLLAELLFEQSLFDEATREYERTAYQYAQHARAAEAGYAALLSYKRHAATLEGQALADWNRFAIDSALRFADTFPVHEHATAVLTDAAERLFQLGDYAAALAAATQLVNWQPAASQPLLLTAWSVIAHTHFDRADFAQAEQGYLQVLAQMPAQDARREQMHEKLAASVYRQAELKRDAGDAPGAVDAFLRVAQVAPQSSIVATAEYDAAAALMQMEDWTRATGVLQGFRNKHADHPLQGEVTRKLAAAYLASGQPQQAGDELARMAREPDRAMDTRRAAAWSAAEQYELAESGDAAIGIYDYLLSALSAPLDESIDARERIATINRTRGDTLAYHETLRRIIAADRNAAAARSGRSRSAAADAALVLAEARLPGFQAIELSVPLTESLAHKQSAMQGLLDAYGQAASYEVAEVSTASAYRIAEIYRELGEALIRSQRPSGLSELELEQYELLLEEQAFPFEEKAIEVHEANARRSVDGMFNRWVRASFERLTELLPARYAKVEKGESLVTNME